MHCYLQYPTPSTRPAIHAICNFFSDSDSKHKLQVNSDTVEWGVECDFLRTPFILPQSRNLFKMNRKEQRRSQKPTPPSTTITSDPSTLRPSSTQSYSKYLIVLNSDTNQSGLICVPFPSTTCALNDQWQWRSTTTADDDVLYLSSLAMLLTANCVL